MSQIETIMLVMLGFVVAALLALFLSRLIWSYGVKLGKRRTERSAPATIASLQAERDQLRAESAMLSRKLELRLDDLKTRLAEQTAEVSRNRNRIDHLITEVEKRNAAITERDEHIDQLNRHIEPLEAELATRTQAMQQLKEHLRDRNEEVSSTTSEQNRLGVEIAERDREIANLQSELANREAKQQEIGIEAETTQSRLQSQIQELTSLSRQIEQQRAEMSAQFDHFTKLQTETVASEPEPAAISPEGTSGTAKKVKSSGKKTKQGALKALVSRKPAAPDENQTSMPGTESDDVDDRVKIFESKGHALEQQIIDAERETDELQDELKKLDEVWAEKIAALNKAAPRTVDKRAETEVAEKEPPQDVEQSDGRSRQNVISLAARIRALQKNSAEN